MAPPKRKIADLASPSPTENSTEGASSEDEQEIQADATECLFQVDSFQQPSPKPSFPQQMENVYIVRPTTIWAALRNYDNFVINEEQLSSSCTVRVLRSPRPDSGPNDDASSIWIARVLEVRAHSPQHVYLRVFWIYKPADLPDGKQAYHGDHEMIVSDNMTVIDASAVVGSVEVRKWDEERADTPPEGLWWRQRLEMSTRKLSPPKLHCTCHQPFNPSSTPLLRCPHCSLRLHKSCIIEAKLAALDGAAAFDSNTIVVAPATASKKKKQMAKKKDQLFHVELTINGGDSGDAKLVIEDRRREKVERWEERVVCLDCRRSF